MIRKAFYALAATTLALIGVLSIFWIHALWALVVVGPFLLLGTHDVLQRRHSLLRNYPIIGHGRYLMEALRPEIQQYFVETNTDGRPYSREFRSIVYQRAKSQLQTQPFGTQRDVDEVGYEWLNHSMAPREPAAQEPRVRIGGPDCEVPYDASHLNISAMSFGSLSGNAIEAMNLGAQRAGFYHNTGEGGLSPHHLAHDGDLVWQIGTGYFGCRTPDGGFDPDLFAEEAARPQVRMIELKLSQGAKPSHGGILPAKKISAEIARIRKVPTGRDVVSPPGHRTFSTPRELMEFIARLRELAGGKPIGLKLCVGRHDEFFAICKAMLATGITPDYIAVDGGEGGTGAAPLEFSNSVGHPLGEALLFVHNALVGCRLRDRIRIVASGKIVTGFHLIRAKALGADLCAAARPMMFAVGCIQARRCNNNDCPVGVATQDPILASALSVEDKGPRVELYHRDTIASLLHLVGAAGLASPDDVRPDHITRRVAHNLVRRLDELYEFVEPGALIEDEPPRTMVRDWDAADAERF